VEKNVDMCVTEAEKIRSDIVYVGSGFNNFHAIALGRKLESASNFVKSAPLT